MTIVDANLAYRVSELERDLDGLAVKLDRTNQKIDRLMWAIVTLAITIAGSTLVFALTTLTQGGS